MNDKMTWEETIQHIRNEPDYSELVAKAYFDADLELNVQRFKNSLEFKETESIINTYAPKAKTILDIGCGNGISAINFAQKGYYVTAVEPDSSETVGAGAIRALKKTLNLDNIEIFEDFAENIQFDRNSFDIVYVRQAMHHANHLNNFIGECVRVLKPNGLLLTIRDHVILDDKDKSWFFEAHPLHKFYGGENAYTTLQYRQAIKNAGATILKELKYYDSVINFFPKTQQQIDAEVLKKIEKQRKKLQHKLGFFAHIPLVWWLYRLFSGYNPLDEKQIAGRMYSYIALKK
jgi:2-polyprenyl-3-methyl-5-hydroxy-6-metoxy-1,4-benzoquinol methylase